MKKQKNKKFKLNKVLSVAIIFIVVAFNIVSAFGFNTPCANDYYINKTVNAEELSPQIEHSDSIYLVDISLVKNYGDNIYIYDKEDKTIKIIDKQTNTYKETHNHYKTEGLEDLFVCNNVILIFDGENFSAIDQEFNQLELNFDCLTTITTAKAHKFVSYKEKHYILTCPSNPVSGIFEIAELVFEEDQVTAINKHSFSTSANFLSEYKDVFLSINTNSIEIMFSTDEQIHSFEIDPENTTDGVYSIFKSIVCDSVDNMREIINISEATINQTKVYLLSSPTKISVFTLETSSQTISFIPYQNKSIVIDPNFEVTNISVDKNNIALISNENQSLKTYSLLNQGEQWYQEQNIVNPDITTEEFSCLDYRYVKALGNLNLKEKPYDKDNVKTITENPEDSVPVVINAGEHVAIIGQGIENQEKHVIGWHYVIYTIGNKNYYGYIDDNITELANATYEKSYVTVLSYTKLYKLPSKISDSKNVAIKSIKSSSRLEVLSSMQDYESTNSQYLLVKVNGDSVGFIERARVLNPIQLEDRIIPNASVMHNNSKVYTSTSSDKEVIITLNKGARVKVIGKRNTKTNYTKVSFNDIEGNEYTGYINTSNLEADTWSMLQIVGIFLVIINVFILVIIIIVKNRVTR